MIYNITPIPKPRQTRSDKWKKRPCVMRYRAFADECRAAGMIINECGSEITFIIPMPKSWSKGKRIIKDGEPHKQTPDLDNLIKSCLDAVLKDDSHVWMLGSTRKLWGHKGKIIIE